MNIKVNYQSIRNINQSTLWIDSHHYWKHHIALLILAVMQKQIKFKLSYSDKIAMDRTKTF